MRRLYSFIVILAIGIAAGTAGSFWYSPASRNDVCDRRRRALCAGESRAEGPLLPQPDGRARHLSGAEEGLHGDGLHPRLCRRARERGHGQSKPRQDPANRGEDREGRGQADRPHRPRRRQGGARRGSADHRHRALRRAISRSCSSTRPVSTSKRASRSSASTARRFSWRNRT